MLQRCARMFALQSAVLPTGRRLSSLEAAPRKLSVITSHPDFIAINKPAGLPFHSRDGAQGVIPTIRSMEANGLLPEQGPLLYPLHRLDEVTSGIMLLGRNADAARQISTAFETGKVKKCYIALSDRKPSKKQGIIKGDMAKARRGSWKLLRTMTDPAVTHFTSFGIQNSRPGLRMFLVKPVTGRTHQIRVAMKSLGSPILGDVRYADAIAAQKEDRTYLHAASIRFSLQDQSFHVLCCPDAGAEFTSAAFQSAWQQHLPWIEQP